MWDSDTAESAAGNRSVRRDRLWVRRARLDKEREEQPQLIIDSGRSQTEPGRIVVISRPQTAQNPPTPAISFVSARSPAPAYEHKHLTLLVFLLRPIRYES